VSNRSEEAPKQPLPIHVEHQWAALLFAAEGAATTLRESWKRPVRHNKKIERLALWHTVSLEHQCEQAQEPDSVIRLPLQPNDCGPEARYEIESAVRMIPRVVPYLDLDLHRLRADTGETSEDWGEDMAERNPSLVARWHRWLWANDPHQPYAEGEHGQASVLAVAASRLAANIPDALGWGR
jgi:hypothetical protein